MQITLTRHGGLLAGIKRPPRIIDVTSLDPERAERLRALVTTYYYRFTALGRISPKREVRSRTR